MRASHRERFLRSDGSRRRERLLPWPPCRPTRSPPRAVDRTSVRVAARISVADRPRPITLINISSHGFMGECPAGVPLRSRVSLDLPGVGPVPACVRWSVGRRIGGRFDAPLDEAQLAGALAAADAAADGTRV